ncbi:MAG: H-NS histone family protein [Paracoccaceae bacterium]
MNIDLDKLSKKELEKLRSDVDKALATLESRKKAEARKAAEQAAKEHGFSLDDIFKAGAKPKQKSPPKYRNPANPQQTWTGRGRQPGWIKEALEKGKSLSEFAI